MVGVEIQTWLGWERAAALGGRGKERCSFTQVWEDEEGSCQVTGPSLRRVGGSGIGGHRAGWRPTCYAVSSTVSLASLQHLEHRRGTGPTE